MKVSDLEVVTALLKDLKILERLVARDHSWGVELSVEGIGIPQPPHPMHTLWNDTRAEVGGVVKNRMLSRIRRMRIQLEDLGVEVDRKEKEDD